MKNTRLVLLGIFFLAVSLSCSLFTAAATSTEAPVQNTSPATNPSGFITSVTMAKDTQGDQLDAVNPTTVFGSTDVIHAVVAISGAPDNTVFEAVWNTVDVGSSNENHTQIDSSQLTAGGTRNLDFTLSPSSTWPSGTYDVEIYVNGTLDQIVNFSVQ